MTDDLMTIEIKPDKGSFSDTRGHRLYINGKKDQWHYGVADRSTLAMVKMHIRKNSSVGGRIINYDSWSFMKDGEPEVIDVDPCPTSHADIKDDFMGGSVCLDCRSVW